MGHCFPSFTCLVLLPVGSGEQDHLDIIALALSLQLWGGEGGSCGEEVAGAAPEWEIGKVTTNTGIGRGDGQGESSVEE